MQKILLLVCLAAGSMQSFAQKADLIKFEKERVRYTKNSMAVLAGWSAPSNSFMRLAVNSF